jgi:Integral membrane protein S linking to the trans Golgi network
MENRSPSSAKVLMMDLHGLCKPQNQAPISHAIPQAAWLPVLSSSNSVAFFRIFPSCLRCYPLYHHTIHHTSGVALLLRPLPQSLHHDPTSPIIQPQPTNRQARAMPPRRRKPPRAGALTDLPPLKIIRSIVLLQLAYYVIALVLILFTTVVAGQKFSLALIFDWTTVRGDNTVGWMLGIVWLLVSLFA